MDRMYPDVSNDRHDPQGFDMSVRRLLLLPAAATLFALTACNATSAPGSSPAASGPGSPAAVATSAAAASGASGTKPAVATKAPGGAKSADCPSGTTLQKLVELPKGQTFGGVQCVKGWAGADPQGGNAGDGVYLFHYKAGTGWKYYGEGSGYDCKDLGLNEPAPFCIS